MRTERLIGSLEKRLQNEADIRTGLMGWRPISEAVIGPLHLRQPSSLHRVLTAMVSYRHRMRFREDYDDDDR